MAHSLLRRKNSKRRLSMRALQRPEPGLPLVLLVRQRGACWYCGTPLTLATLTVDHQQPVSRGGTGEMSNLVGSCTPCNRAKSNRTVDEYRAALGGRRFAGETREEGAHA